MHVWVGANDEGEGGPGFVNASVVTVPNARQVGTRIDTFLLVRTIQARKWNMGMSSCPEQWRNCEGDQQELKTREQKKKAKDGRRIRRIVHENDRSEGTGHVQDEMEKLMHHDGQELLSLWEGRHLDDNKGGWLDPELCATARRDVVEYISSPPDVHESPQRGTPT